MIYFIYIMSLQDMFLRVKLLGPRLGETLLRRFGAQFNSTPLQKMME